MNNKLETSIGEPPASFAQVRRQLESAALIADVLHAAAGDNNDNDDLTCDDDPINGYTVVSERIGQAIQHGEQLERSQPAPFSKYLLRMVYVKDHMDLLTTKAGCLDFDRCSAVGLAQWLVRDLLRELRHFEGAEKQAA